MARPILRQALAVVAGFVVGSVVNMGLVMLGPTIVPPPPGADVTTTEGLKASMHLFEGKHFVFPFLAHALGTLAGAIVATMLAPRRTSGPAWIVGVLFLIGGITASAMLPAPFWFEALDAVLAYLPMAWLGHRLASRGSAPSLAPA